MTYFCFVDTSSSSTPHMHAMDAQSLADAGVEAQRLMRQHAGSNAARIYLNAAEVAVLQAERQP